MGSYIGRDIFYPTVYDSMTIIRPSVCFREGITMANCMSRFNTFMLGLPYNTTYLLAVTHLIPADYKRNLEIPARMHWAKQTDGIIGILEESYSRAEASLAPNNRQDLVLGFASLYLLVKSYNNSLVAEVSQQMYGGILRCISLGPTEGLSTWKCSIQLNVQAVIVPVGRISLGRILNVVGSAVDLYDDQPTALAYGQSPICKGFRRGAHAHELAGVVAIDGGTTGLEVTFPAFLAVILGLFIPVVFLIPLYIQSEAQGTASNFRMPDIAPGVKGPDFNDM